MKKTKLTILSLVFALVLMLGFALCINAEEADATADLGEPVETWDISATTEDNVIAELYKDVETGEYMLYIYGNGTMKDWQQNSTFNNSNWSSKLSKIVVNYGVTNIGKKAFKGITGIETVEIANSVTKIGEEAFSGCRNLTSINIPDSIQYIATQAFLLCSNLKEVNITSIDSWCEIDFGNDLSNPIYYSKSLYLNGTLVSDITISKNINKINNYAFYNCESLKSIKFLGNLSSIGEDAFYCCYNLQKIEISNENVNLATNDTVTSIGSRAFYACRNLKSITLPDAITNIGLQAFNYCSSLTSIEIPSSVTSIGGSAFSGCNSLTNVEIPSGVTSIEPGTFNGCSGLTNINIPNGVTSIKENAFYSCESLTSIEIPDSVISVGRYAFYNCTSLSIVKISASVTSIGSSAFYNCSNLEEVHITDLDAWCEIDFQHGANPISYSKSLYLNGELVTDVVISKNVKAYVFYEYTPLKSVTLTSEVTSIGESAFYDCTNLTSIEISSSVTSIGEYAFSGCSSLTSIEIPNSIISIGFRAFHSCSSLTNVEIPSGVTSIEPATFDGCSGLTNIKIPNSVTSIGYNAFDGCSSLTSIEIPNSVASIGPNAFYNCSNLKEVNICDLNAWCEINFDNSNSNPLGYAKNLYLNGELVTDVILSNDVKSITFFNCKSLATVTLLDGTTCIGSSAFNGCSSLTSIEIPSGVTSIGSYAFEDCSSLTSIEIPNSVTSIGEAAFNGCSSLAIITFEGNSQLTSIGNSAFIMCSKLASIEIPNGVTSIGSFAFKACSSLTSIEIPSGVTSIGEETFYNCRSLTSISFEECSQLTSIEIWAFYGCSNLTSIKIPSSVTSIGNFAFWDCINLSTIEIPNSVTSIGRSAFYNCSSLTSIKIPSSVTSVGNAAFWNCNNLKVVMINSPTIASSITSSDSCGYLTNYATTVVISPDITEIGSYITDNFTNVTTLNVIYNGEVGTYNVYSKHSHEADSGVWSEKDENCVQVCSECGLQKVVHVAGEAVIENVLDATCQATGSYDEVVYCTDCGAELSRTKVETPKADHTEEVIPAILPTPSVVGYTAGVKCSECGEILVAPVELTITDMANMGDPAFRIDAASLDLAESICVFYKIKAAQDYKNPHMVFVFDGIEYPVTEYTVEPSTGRYVFRFTNAPAYKMAENIEAYVYAETADGEYTRNQLPNYSIMTYCVNQLKKSSISDEFRTVISDVLALGAANQIYEGYKTDELVTELVKNMGYTLTPTVYEGIDSTKNKLSMVGDATASTNWTTANLVIGSNVQVQLKLKTNNVDNVTVKINIDGEVTEYTKKDFKVENGVYIVVLDRLTSKQYDKAITATLYEGETQVGGTLTYSINSYLYRNAESSAHSDEMRALLQTLYVYGETMKSYFN